jgi:hypothetical protein
MGRKRFGPQQSKEYLKSRDKLDLSHGQGKLIKMAHYTIDNSNLTKKQEEKKVKKLLNSLI